MQNQEFSPPTHLPGLLVVSGAPDVGGILSVLLVDHFQVRTAATASEAFDAVARTSPDLVLVALTGRDDDLACFLRTVHGALEGRIVLIAGPAHAWANGLAEWPVAGVFREPYDLDALVARLIGLVRFNGYRPPELRVSRSTARVFAFFSRNHGQPLTLKAIGQAVGVSPGYLVHIFREETGMTLRECLTRIRIEMAKYHLRHTDQKLEVIAQHTGFYDASHLCRVFLRYVGHRPGEYRHRLLEWWRPDEARDFSATGGPPAAASTGRGRFAAAGGLPAAAGRTVA
jgi:AraC-like DNA-binding protein